MDGTTTAKGLVSPCPNSPPDSIDAPTWDALTDEARAAWHDLSADDRWHLLDAAQARARIPIETPDQRRARIDAAADPDTMAAFDELLADVRPTDVPVIRIGGDTGNWDTEPECPNKVARTATTVEGDEWTTNVVLLDCERRACVVCGPRWAHTWEMNIHANFADEATVTVLDFADDEWETVRKAIARNRNDGEEYVRIPTEAPDVEENRPGRSLVVTSTSIDRGHVVTPSEAVRATGEALRAVTHRANVDRRRVTTSRNFVKAAELRNPSTGPNVIYGQLTRIDTANIAAELARVTGHGVTVSSIINDIDQATPTGWRLRGAPMAMQLALARLGHRTDAELAIEREAREFEEWERRQRRRRPRSPFSIEDAA